MGSKASRASLIQPLWAATSSSEIVGSPSSAWSMRTRTVGALADPTTSTSTTSMPWGAAASSNAATSRFSRSVDATLSPSRPAASLHTKRKRGKDAAPLPRTFTIKLCTL